MKTCKSRGLPARSCALASIAALVCGCISTSGEEERFGVAEEAALNPNALNPNALNPNALNPNALNPNALNPNALNPNALSPGALSAIQDPGDAGTLSREFLLYAVSCAFGPGQSFDFSWTDACGAEHDESYPGLLGLAPSWQTSALDTAGQQWVSDCLASRVNALGVSVVLSSRGTNPALATTAVERADYQTREAVWFGNLFTETPLVYACYDPLSMLPAELQDRVCAQPELLDVTLGDLTTVFDCGPIEVIGPCTELLGLITVGYCSSEDPTDDYLYDCVPPGGSEVVLSITTFLAGSIPW
jgi:hypothetical protein